MSEDEATAATAPAEEEADIAQMLDLSKKKKKPKKKSSKKSKSEKKEAAGGDDDGAAGGEEAASDYFADQQRRLLEQEEKFESEFVDEHDRKADYTYSDLLDRVVDILHSNNPDIGGRRRTMKPPQLTRVGTKKTLWVNFQEICTIMQRSPEHVFQFFMAELGTEGSIDGNQRLVIRGKYVPKYIESLLKKYIMEYVTCQMCRSPNTELVKDSSTRLQFINCKDCGSSRSVAAIRSGYHATSRADRRAARNAAG